MLVALILIILLLVSGGVAGYRAGYYGNGGMGVVGFILILIVVFILAGPGFAHAADETTVSALPLYKILEPYVITFVGAATPVLMTWALVLTQSRLSFLKDVRLTEQAKASVQQAAENAAGRVLAKAEGPVATLKFDTHSPAIALEITKLQTSVGSAIDKLGMTPDRVADLVLGKVGVLQSQSVSPAVVVASNLDTVKQ